MYWTGSTVEVLVKLPADAGAFAIVAAAAAAIKPSHSLRSTCLRSTCMEFDPRRERIVIHRGRRAHSPESSTLDCKHRKDAQRPRDLGSATPSTAIMSNASSAASHCTTAGYAASVHRATSIHGPTSIHGAAAIDSAVIAAAAILVVRIAGGIVITTAAIVTGARNCSAANDRSASVNGSASIRDAASHADGAAPINCTAARNATACTAAASSCIPYLLQIGRHGARGVLNGRCRRRHHGRPSSERTQRQRSRSGAEADQGLGLHCWSSFRLEDRFLVILTLNLRSRCILARSSHWAPRSLVSVRSRRPCRSVCDPLNRYDPLWSRMTQRNPTWLADVSIASAWRAAGR
jgi:hypothetical protein